MSTQALLAAYSSNWHYVDILRTIQISHFSHLSRWFPQILQEKTMHLDLKELEQS